MDTNFGGKKNISNCNCLIAKIEMPINFNISLYLREVSRLSLKEPKITFEQEEFERCFDIYSSDENKAQILLNEDIIKTMLNFYNESKMHYEMTIKNNYIYIKFETGKIFSHSLYKEEPITKEGLYKYNRILDFTLDITNKLLNAANN